MFWKKLTLTQGLNVKSPYFTTNSKTKLLWNKKDKIMVVSWKKRIHVRLHTLCEFKFFDTLFVLTPNRTGNFSPFIVHTFSIEKKSNHLNAVDG